MKEWLSKAAGYISYYLKNFIDTLKQDLRDPENRRAAIAGGIIIGIAIAAVIVVLGITGTKPKKSKLKTVKKAAAVEQETVSIKAHLNGNDIEVRNKGRQQYVYVNGKNQRKSHYSNIQAMGFDLDSVDPSKDILKQADASRPAATGSRIFRGEQYQIESYLAFLKKKDYTVDSYIIAGGYADIYLKKKDETYRFLVINKTDNVKILIFDRYKGKIPDRLPEERS